MFSTSQLSLKLGSSELREFSTVRTLIGSLLMYGCPAYIAGFVVSIFIRVTIKRVPPRTLADISEKILKAIPTFANSDTTSTIIFIFDVLRIAASSVHASPNSIKRMACSIFSGIPMRTSLHASTRLNKATAKIVCRRRVTLSTITTTEPQNISVGISFGGWSNCNQSAKTLACNINRLGGYASARATFRSSKFRNTNDRRIAAVTFTQPHYASIGVFVNWSNRNQSTKALACDIDGFGHRAALIGSKSSSEMAHQRHLAAHSIQTMEGSQCLH